MLNEFKGKIILVTGGTGSIGSKIVEELIQYEPRQIRIYSRDETKQFELLHRLGNRPGINLLIGDIRDKERLNLAMENVDIVFHAAALKHVLSCERNPFEAVKTNVYGTQNVIDCALANKVQKVIGVSTDKATDPINVMGCTKLLAEKIMLASFFYKGKKETKFCFVRFGNVLFSRGSVVPLFIEQIKNGQALTVTDENMTRFVMSTKQAAELIFKATAMMKDREIFILKMPALRVLDLAKALINIFAPKFDRKPENVEIKLIGKKNGERIHEKLLSSEEADYALETDDMFIITPVTGADEIDFVTAYPGAKPTKFKEYSTISEEKLSVQAIEDLLLREGVADVRGF
jgi:FlaA1/EpsC-like NDP-sugar epimerase